MLLTDPVSVLRAGTCCAARTCGMCLNWDVPEPASGRRRAGQGREGPAVPGSHCVIMLIETMAYKAPGRA